MLNRNKFITGPIGSFRFVGKSKAIEVFELGAGRFNQRFGDLRKKAVEAFQAGKLEESLKSWEDLEGEFGPNKLSTRYRSEIEGDPPNRSGVIKLTEK